MSVWTVWTHLWPVENCLSKVVQFQVLTSTGSGQVQVTFIYLASIRLWTSPFVGAKSIQGSLQELLSSKKVDLSPLLCLIILRTITFLVPLGVEM